MIVIEKSGKAACTCKYTGGLISCQWLGALAESFIFNVATHPHARGRGHARALMTELVRWLDGEGDADRIDLAATP